MDKRLAQGESVPSFVFQKSLLQTQIFRKISNEALYQNKRDLIKRTKKKIRQIIPLLNQKPHA